MVYECQMLFSEQYIGLQPNRMEHVCGVGVISVLEIHEIIISLHEGVTFSIHSLNHTGSALFIWLP